MAGGLSFRESIADGFDLTAINFLHWYGRRLTNRLSSVRRAFVEVGRGSSSIYPTYPRLSLNHPRLS